MIHLSKDCTATPTGSYAHKGLYPTLRLLTALLIMTLTTAMAWAANSDATTLSTGNDDVPALQEGATDMDWATLKTALEAGNNVTLTNDVTRNANEHIEVTKEVTLDLNGHTIYGYETGSDIHYNNYNIFIVTDGGKLTITDGSSGKRGTITNVKGTSAISVGGTDESSYGEAVFEAGTIASGGVAISGYSKFTMTGGTISTGDIDGVSFIDNATFTMTGGTITGNDIGVRVMSPSSTFTMTGGTITGNDSGVMFMEASTTFTVSGNVNITGNTERDVSLFYQQNFTPIHIGGELAGTARIGVWTDQDALDIAGKIFTEGLNGNGSKANFVSNNADLVVVTDTSGELALAFPITAHQASFNGITKYWATFFHPNNNYRLSEGSQAFYIKENDTDNALYLVGDDGSIIPFKAPVIIMSDTDKIVLYKSNEPAIAPDDNKLIGTNVSKEVSDVYVLSAGDDGKLGFYKFTGEIPAHRAYYVDD